MSTNVSLYMDQGTTFGNRLVVHYKNDQPVDLTDATINVVFRRSLTSNVSFSFTVTKEDPANGTILLTMSATDTQNLNGRYVFGGDYQLPNGAKYVFIKGILNVSPRVTR
jgi:hypothetical protein